jgi:hypothetical protein
MMHDKHCIIYFYYRLKGKSIFFLSGRMLALYQVVNLMG